MTTPEIVTTVADLRARVAAWRSEGARVGLVPTMGALHEGHLSLAREAGKLCGKTVVSIFVNPAQFAPHEDFDRYPRPLDQDLAKVGETTALVFAPGVAEMYPDGFATRLEMTGPALGLETDFRPHFFSGVAIVVAKLLIVAMPDVAMFGEKDYQQLMVVRRLVRDLGLPVEIVGGGIVREPDGLAMSSRNAYLDPRERMIAGKLNTVIKKAVRDVCGGKSISVVEADATKSLLDCGFDVVDYVAVRDAQTLAATSDTRNVRVLAAVRIGKTRLIDNMGV